MIQIVVNGVFVEEFKETNIRHVYRSFARTFSIVPVGNGWSIISDMLFVTVVSDEILLVSKMWFEFVYFFVNQMFYIYRNRQNDFMFLKQNQQHH